MEQKEVVIAFGPFRLLPAQRQLWHDEERIEVQPMPLAVLAYLAQHPDQVVSVEELHKAIWAGTYVSRTVIRVCVREIRQALGDEAATPHYIETIGRQGYRFIGYPRTPASTANLPSEQSSNQERASRDEALTTPFVGRERELVQLRRWFARAQQGQRQVVFVSGEPGIGKTTLVHQFVAQLSDAVSVRIGRGQCVEPYGQGEAYLPLLEAIGRLSREIGVGQLRAVLQQHAPTWLAQLPALVDLAKRGELQRQVAGSTQDRMLRELCEALEVLTAEQPLILVLEDLHWSDTATLAWLAAVARRPEPARLLILGTYRPSDVVLHVHPLRGLVQELRPHRLCRELRLELLNTDDVTEYVRRRFAGTAPAEELGWRLYQRTDGNPLFLVASIDVLIQQGSVVEDSGRWVVRGDLAALEATVPEDLQQLITKQVEAVSAEEQQILAAASVSGETFTTAEVAAGCKQELEAIEARCEQLSQRGQFIEVDTFEEWPDGTLTMSYRFHHVLYQQGVYGQLSTGQKVRLHRLIGERKEAGYRGHEAEVASALAVHFERGREHGKAGRYHQLAAEQALQRSAYQEALSHSQAGLARISSLPETADRARQELALRLSLSAALTATQGFTAPALADHLQRAQELCRAVDDTASLVPVLVGLSRFAFVRADRAAAEAIVEQMQHLLAHVHDPALAVQLHAPLGTIEVIRGGLPHAREHHEQILALCDLTDRRSLPFFFGGDPAVTALINSGWCQWLAGWPDDALRRVVQGLARAEELAHPFTITAALLPVVHVRQWRGELSAAQTTAQRLVTFASEHGFSLYQWLGILTQDCILIQGGEVEAGVTAITEALPQYRTTGAGLFLPFFLSFLAQGYCQLQQIEKSFATVDEALHLTATTLDVFWAAELYRLKGEVTLKSQVKTSPRQVSGRSKTSRGQGQGKSRTSHGQIGNNSAITSTQPSTPNTQAEAEAEACFQQAIEIARQQGAKSLELRAAMSLCRLWQHQGKRDEARPLLAETCNWFTEGFDTQNLRDAKALLVQLS